MRRFLPLFLLVAPLASAQTPGEAPVLVSLTVNGVGSASIRPGWPLLVTADVLLRPGPAGAPSSVTIADGGESWENALQLDVFDSVGEKVAWPLHRVASTAGALDLDETSGGRVAYWLSPDETAALATGTYVLHARLDSAALGAPGALRSPRAVPVDLTLDPSAEGEDVLPLLLAEYHALRGQTAAALAAVDALLAADAAHPSGLAYRGTLLELDGRTREAIEALEVADSAAAPGASAMTSFLLAQARDAWEHATSFEVSLQPKGPTHPFAQQGGPLGYAIDGTPGEELILAWGVTYTFRLADVPADAPFYLTTNPVGGGGDAYTDGVEGTPATGTAVVTFTPDARTPEVLYYGSTSAPHMGWRLRVRPVDPVGSGSEEPEMPGGASAFSVVYPNPVAGVAHVDITLEQAQATRIELFDLLGRRVRLLYDGPLDAGRRSFVIDASGLPAGHYVARATGEQFTAVTHFVVVR